MKSDIRLAVGVQTVETAGESIYETVANENTAVRLRGHGCVAYRDSLEGLIDGAVYGHASEVVSISSLEITDDNELAIRIEREALNLPSWRPAKRYEVLAGVEGGID